MQNSYSHLMVAVDFSTSSQAALNRALKLADNLQSQITLMHVVELPVNPILEDTAVTGLPGIWDEELTKQWVGLAEKQMDEWMEKIPAIFRESLNIKAKVQIGHPVQEICDYADKNSVDCILIGYHGHSALRNLIGSTSRSVLVEAPCDVLNVKLKQES